MSLTPEQLALRRTFVGASESACLVNLNLWDQGPMHVWLAKKGLAEPVEEIEASHWGNVLEPVVAEEWSTRNERAIVRGTETLFHPESRIIGATPDYYVGDDELLQIKTAGLRVAHHWGFAGDDIPDAYMVQVQQELMVTGRKRWNLAVLIGGQEFRQYSGEADPETQAALREVIERFWRDHVLADVPPELDASPETKRWLANRFEKSSGHYRIASVAETELVEKLRRAKAAMKAAKGEADFLQVAICAAIGEDDGLAGEFGKCTYRMRKTYRVEAHEVAAGRVFKATFKGEVEDG